MYFNQCDFLNQAVGIKSAAQVYFSTFPDSLKIEEGAMLVGMAKNPAYYNPADSAKRERVQAPAKCGAEPDEKIRFYYHGPV